MSTPERQPHGRPRGGAEIDERTERTLGRALQVGVLVAGAIVFAAGVAFLVAHGGDPASFKVFRGEPGALASPSGIIAGLGSPHPSTYIQLGLLVLIATPVLRVVLSVFSFARLRDLLYVGVTLVVLGVLLFGLISGR